MNNCILHRHEYQIIKVGQDFIVYNTNKPFRAGHSHLNNFNSCISAIKLSERKELPKNKSKYFINSLIRISTDEEYIERLKDLFIDYERMMKENTDIDSRKCL